MGSLAIKAADAEVCIKTPGYPDAQGYRSGCKVFWLYFVDKADAYKAAEVAKVEAVEAANKGYDFGWQVPGSVTLMREGSFKDFFEVCLP